MDDKAWLRLDYYRNLPKRENPWGLVCALCEKTHKSTDCPHKNPLNTVVEKPKDIYYTDYSTMYAGYDDDSCGY